MSSAKVSKHVPRVSLVYNPVLRSETLKLKKEYAIKSHATIKSINLRVLFQGSISLDFKYHQVLTKNK